MMTKLRIFFIINIGMLDKKIILSFCLLEAGGKRGPEKNKLFLKSQNGSRFFFNTEIIELNFEDLKTLDRAVGDSLKIVSKRQK